MNKFTSATRRPGLSHFERRSGNSRLDVVHRRQPSVVGPRTAIWRTPPISITSRRNGRRD